MGPLSFASPLVLLGLLALPLVWLLARATPPPPTRATFPPLLLLRRLASPEETPRRAPWWLTALRVLAAGLVVLGLAGPVLFARDGAADARPLTLVIDDTWASAARWGDIVAEAAALAEEAGAAGAPVRLVLASRRSPAPPDAMTAADARAALAAAAPLSYDAPADAAARALAAAPGGARVVWFTDGLARPGQAALARAVGAAEGAERRGPARGQGAVAATAAAVEPEGVRVRLALGPAAPPVVTLTAGALDGRVFARRRVALPDAPAVTALIAVEPGLLSQVGLVRVEGQGAAGAFVLDGAARRPRVGLVGGDSQASPLTSDAFYLERALAPYALMTTGRIDVLTQAGVDALLLADAGPPAPADQRALAAWVERGGVLIRFAGPRLAENPAADPLLPGRVRPGVRRFGGAVSWEREAALAPFDADSPFAGLDAPRDVVVRAQILPEPGAPVATWARLADGSALVTAQARGRGLVILTHVTAGPAWSDLPYSGVYVAMLRRMLAFAGRGGAAPAQTGGPLRASVVLDGSGRPAAPGADVAPLPAGEAAGARPAADRPPGLYVRGAASVAVNLGPWVSLRPGAAAGAPQAGGAPARAPIALGGGLLLAGVLLLAADLMVALWAAGRLGRLARPAGTAAALALALGALWAPDASAQDRDRRAADEFRLAYVRTGDPATDGLAEAGLRGLSRALNDRTAVATGAPVGVTPGTDSLALYPVLYWLLPPAPQPLGDAAVRALDRYLRTGGLVFIDTRGATRPGGADPRALRAALSGLELPALQRAGDGHVLAKTFYLLRGFPGRTPGASLFVEREADADPANDGVSPIIVGDGEWASAWAIGPDGRALFPVEGGERGREMALRVGINVTLYALTGNYKADQVHVPALLERMGRR